MEWVIKVDIVDMMQLSLGYPNNVKGLTLAETTKSECFGNLFLSRSVSDLRSICSQSVHGVTSAQPGILTLLLRFVHSRVNNSQNFGSIRTI